MLPKTDSVHWRVGVVVRRENRNLSACGFHSMKKLVNAAAGCAVAGPPRASSLPAAAGPRAHGKTRLSFILHPGLHIHSLIFSKLTKLSHSLELLYYMEAALEERSAGISLSFFFSPFSSVAKSQMISRRRRLDTFDLKSTQNFLFFFLSFCLFFLLLRHSL